MALSAFNAVFNDTGIDPLLPDAPLTPKEEAEAVTAWDRLRDTPFDPVAAAPFTSACKRQRGFSEAISPSPVSSWRRLTLNSLKALVTSNVQRRSCMRIIRTATSSTSRKPDDNCRENTTVMVCTWRRTILP